MEETKKVVVETTATEVAEPKKGFFGKLKDKLPAKAETVEATEPKPKKDHKILKAIGFGAIAALAGVGGYFIGKGKKSGSSDDDDYVDADYEEYSTEETEE